MTATPTPRPYADASESAASASGQTASASGLAASASGQAALTFRPVALAFRVLAFVFIALGIVRISDLFGPEPSWSAFSFYTVQSNVLCLVWVAALIWATVRGLRRAGTRGTSTPSARWSAAVMMAITVTMLVYLVVLVPATFVQDSTYVPFSFTDNLIHIITPCLLIVDWLLFVPKGELRVLDPVRWAVIPYCYLLFAAVYGGLGGEFAPGQHVPYPFLNVAEHGLLGVVWRVALLTVALVGVGYVYFGLDRAFARLGRTRR